MGKFWKFVLAVSLLMNVSVIVAAGWHYCERHGCLGKHRGGVERRVEALSDKLGLTAEQREAITAMDVEFRREARETRGEIREKRARLIDLLREDDPDREAIDALVTELSSVQERMEHLVVDHIIEEKSVLTPEQGSVFLDIIEQRTHRKRPGRKGGK